MKNNFLKIHKQTHHTQTNTRHTHAQFFVTITKFSWPGHGVCHKLLLTQSTAIVANKHEIKLEVLTEMFPTTSLFDWNWFETTKRSPNSFCRCSNRWSSSALLGSTFSFNLILNTAANAILVREYFHFKMCCIRIRILALFFVWQDMLCGPNRLLHCVGAITTHFFFLVRSLKNCFHSIGSSCGYRVSDLVERHAPCSHRRGPRGCHWWVCARTCT